MGLIVEPDVKFIVFATARSGSSFLTTSLRSHPDILCHGEVMHPRLFARHVRGSVGDMLEPEQINSDPVAFANTILSVSDNNKAVGFKIFPTHAPQSHDELLGDETIRKIILKRHNLLAAFSSLRLARATGRWNAKKEGVAPKATVPFIHDEFETYRQRVESYYRKIDDLCAGPRIDLSYEDHILAQDVSSALDFLDVDRSVEVSSPKKKLYGRGIAERFDNRSEVLDHLKAIGRSEWAYE